MTQLKILRNNKDVELNNIFVVKEDYKGIVYNCKSNLKLDLRNAIEKICFVLESGMTDDIAQMLYETTARKYIIVPNIDEIKYKSLAGRVVVREVDNIKGNYAIIDGKKVYVFNDKLDGVEITHDSVGVLQQIFLREFWENGREEFIDKKTMCGEVTFDIPPIYGNEDVLIDDSFANESKVKTAINQSTFVALTNKITNDFLDKRLIILKTSKNNQDLLVKNNVNVQLAPELPFNLTNVNDDFYYYNFNIENYSNLPEKGQGRLFAIKLDNNNLNFGKMYDFKKHLPMSELVGKEILDIDENKVEVLQKLEVTREIALDLYKTKIYSQLDEESLEARLEKKNPNFFNIEEKAVEVTYKINVLPIEKTIKTESKIYEIYKKVNEEKDRITASINKFVIDNKIKHIKTNSLNYDKVTTIDYYKDSVQKINSIIDELNNQDSLGEVLNSNKKQVTKFAKIKEQKIDMDLPKYGILYEHKGKFEYVLDNKDDLDKAINEMQNNGIDKADIIYI